MDSQFVFPLDTPKINRLVFVESVIDLFLVMILVPSCANVRLLTVGHTVKKQSYFLFQTQRHLQTEQMTKYMSKSRS